MKKFYFYALFLYITVGCTSSKVSSSASSGTTSYMQLAEKKLGEGVDYILNDSKTYVLCMHEVAGSSQQLRNNIYYLVINVEDNSVVLENRVNGGTVSWYNEKMIQVYQTPGIVRKDQSRDDFITLYNVETGKSYPKNLKQTH